MLGLVMVAWPILSTTQQLSPSTPPSRLMMDAKAVEPIAPIPLSLTLDAKRVSLGERLFKDTRLSGDGTRSCVTCHPLDRGAMDGRMRAIATDGKARLRNTPTLFNVGFNFAFNWDGATTSLESHAQKLLANASVMNANWPEVLARLRADKTYSTWFGGTYSDGVTQANVLDALATFERSLITPNARLDRYLRGEHDALTATELRGYRLFKSHGCVACHQGMNVGGNLFQRFGVFQEPVASSGSSDETDVGRYRVTSNERDRQVFRVPSLRNVALTAPYFHDGRAPTLAIAVETMARVQLGRELESEETQAIVAFLYTLTGEYQGKSLTVTGAR